MYKQLEEYVGSSITYKQMCEVLNLKYYSGGKSKQLQIKDIGRYYELYKVKTKHMIVSKRECVLEKQDKRKDTSGNNAGYRKEYDGYNVEKNRDNDNGVYCIALNENLYIGSTGTTFRKRFQAHIGGKNGQPHTKEMLNNGGLFQELWISDVDDEYIIREVEQMYIDYFMANKYWSIANRMEETVCLSEKKKRYKNKTIKVDERQYELALEILKEHGIMIGGENNE